MIKAVVDLPETDPPEKLVILGLSQGNIENLMEGKPILVQLGDLGVAPQQVAITFGVTEDAIVADIERDLGPAAHSIRIGDRDGD